MKSELLNKIHPGDCIDFMIDMPDDYIDLAIVDPPYGLKKMDGRMTGKGRKDYLIKNWDEDIPNEKYFNMLFKKSKNQIIWGGNYFVDYIYPSMGWIFWDKKKYNWTMSDGELAWSSFKKKLKVFSRYVNQDKGFLNKGFDQIHPTQKPLALYRWLLQNYAKPGQLILDTHSGSGSCAIACMLEGYDFIAIEKDKDYYNDSVKRLDLEWKRMENSLQLVNYTKRKKMKELFNAN